VNKHLSSAQIVNYQRRSLAPADLLGVDDHLAECLKCRRLIESTLNNEVAGLYADLTAASAAGPHLSFDQHAAYVDGLLTGEERRMVEDHIASCAVCAPLMDDLRAFRNEIAPGLDREYGPQAATMRKPRPGWRDRIAAALPAPLVKIPLWVYATSVLSLLAVGLSIMAPQLTEPQIVLVPPTPTRTPPNNNASPTPGIVYVIERLNDGGSLMALDSSGQLAGSDQWPYEYRKMAVEALSNQRAPESPFLAGLNRRGSSLMGGPDEGQRFAIIEPAGKVLLTNRPTFKWTRFDGASGYVVEIYDAQFNLVSSSPTLTDVSWTPPQLTRGRVYSWQVKAISGGQEVIAPHPSAPQAKFRILDQAETTEIARARREYPSSHLLLGLLYARAGLVAEAEREFRALQNANPDSGAARKLLASVSSQRR
jgi:hypothetical protein